MFWETFLSLCRQKNEAPNVVTKKLGLSSGSATFWKNGKVPHHSTLLKIADYFGVSVDYLLGKEKSPSAKAEEPVGLDKLIIDSLKTLSDEDKQKVIAMMQIFLSKKE